MVSESTIHIDPAIVGKAVETRPGMQDLQSAVRARFGVDQATARGFAERLLTSQLRRVGVRYLEVMVGHIQRVFEARERIAGIIEQVLRDEGTAPQEAGQQLERWFRDIHQEVEAITSPGEFARTAPIEPPKDIELDFNITPDERARQASPEANKIPAPQASGRHVERLDRLKARLETFPAETQGTLRKAAELVPNELWRAIASETEAGQARSLKALKARAEAAGMSPAEIEALERAVPALSRERAGSQRLAGGAEAGRAAEGLQHLSPELRKLAEGDPWILEPLAKENPQQLQEDFERSGATTRNQLRRFVRRRMVTHVRGLLGEFTAAFELGDRLVLLKGPDYKVTIPGTDLVGVTRDGRVWLIDNKAMTPNELRSVTSLTNNIPKNLAEDAAAFRNIKGLENDPAILDAVNRIDAANKEVRDLGLSVEQAKTLEAQEQITAICKKHRIERVVTNAGGNINGLSAGLEGRGIRLENLNRALERDIEPKP
jgi:hypothetical protein